MKFTHSLAPFKEYEYVLKNFKTLDVETTGLHTHLGHRPFLYQFGDLKDVLYCSDPDTKTIVDYSNLVDSDKLAKIKEYCEDASIPKCGHNIAFDIGMLNSVGIQVNGLVMDTMVMAHLIDENLPQKNLNYLTKKFTPHNAKDDGVKLWFKEHKIKQADWKFDMVDQDIMVKYSIQDIPSTHELALYFMPLLKEMGLWQLFLLEMDVLKVLVKMKKRGHEVDVAYLHGLKGAYENKIAKIEKEIKAIIPKGMNINSPIQLGEYLISEGCVLPQTKTGRWQVNEDALKALEHPLAKLITDMRGDKKTLKTYVLNLLSATDKDNVLHPDFNQAVPVTGRFSSNVQQFPKKDTTIRKAFVPRDGYFNVSIDYDQMEYRVFVDYAKDKPAIQKVIDGSDPHQETADKLGLASRDDAKSVVFGLLYGMTEYGLSYKLGCTVKEAKAMIDGYFELNPAQQAFVQKVTDTISGSYARKVKKRGYVFNKFGRRRTPPRYRDGKRASREKLGGLGVNSIIQGVCADIMRVAMVKVDNHLFYDSKKKDEREATILLQIHDELIIEIPFGKEYLIDEVCEIMGGTGDMLTVPLTVGADVITKNWGEKRKWTGVGNFVFDIESLEEKFKRIFEDPTSYALVPEELQVTIVDALLDKDEEEDLDWL